MPVIRVSAEFERKDGGAYVALAKEIDDVADRQEKLTRKTKENQAAFKDWGGNVVKSFGSMGKGEQAFGPVTRSMDTFVKKLEDVGKALQQGESHFNIFKKSITSVAGTKVGEMLWKNLIDRFPEIPQRLNQVSSSIASFVRGAVDSFRGLGDRARTSFASITTGAAPLSLSMDGIRQGFARAADTVLGFGKNLPLPAIAAFSAGLVGLAAVTAGAVAGIALLAAGFGALIPILISATRETIGYADKIGTLAERTGLGVEALQLLDEVAKKSGTSIDDLAKGVQNMNQAIVKGDPAFKQLGLNLDALRNMQLEERLTAVAGAIGQIGDSGQKTAALRDMFGKVGDALGPLIATIAKGGIEADRFGLALSKAGIAAGKDLNDQFTTLNDTWDRTKRQFGDIVVQSGLLQTAVEELTKALGGLAKWTKENRGPLAETVRQVGDLIKLMALWVMANARAVTLDFGGFPDVVNQVKFMAEHGGTGTRPGVKDPQFDDVVAGASSSTTRTYRSAEEVAKAAKAAAKFAEQAMEITVRAMKEEFERFGPIWAASMGLGPVVEIPTNLKGDAFGRAIAGRYNAAPTGVEIPFNLRGDVLGRQIGGSLLGASPGATSMTVTAAREDLAKADRASQQLSQSLSNVAHLFQLVGDAAKGGIGRAIGMIGGLTTGLGAAIGSLKQAKASAKLFEASGGKEGSKFGILDKLGVGGQFASVGLSLFSGVKSFLGRGERDRKEMQQLQKDLGDTWGGLDKAKKAAAALGISLGLAFSSGNPALAKERIEQFQKTLAKTKSELSDWERGVVGAQARALIQASPEDKDVRAFVEKQRAGAISGLGSAFQSPGALTGKARADAQAYYNQLRAEIENFNKDKGPLNEADRARLEAMKYNAWATGQKLDQKGTGGIRMVSADDARSQAAIASVVFWDTFKAEGLLKAAEAFKPIVENLQASLAGMGGDTAASAILGPIQTLIDLGTTNELFKGAAEGAQGLATTLDSLANRSVPLTAQQFGAFGQQAQTAFEQARQGAIEAGMSAADAQNAAIMGTAPLLQSLVQASQAYGFDLDENTQRLLGMAEASGIAFKTDSTDRLIAAINALTTSLGGIPPVFEETGRAATRSATTTAAAFQATAATTRDAAGAAAAAFVGLHEETTAALLSIAETAAVGTDTLMAQQLAASESTSNTMEGVWASAGDAVLKDFSDTNSEMVDVWSHTESLMAKSLGDTLPSAADIYLEKLALIPKEIFTEVRFRGNPPERGEGLAGGAVNRWFPARRGGHWLNVSEGGRGEYVTVTHRPVAMFGDGGLIASRRVPRGITHAAEGFDSNITDVVFGGGGGTDVASLFSVGRNITDIGGGTGDLSEEIAALRQLVAALPQAIAAAASTPVQVNNSPTIVVQDQSLVKTREGVEAFEQHAIAAIDRALRLNANGLASRVREIVKG